MDRMAGARRHASTRHRQPRLAYSPAKRVIAVSLAAFLLLCLIGGGASRMSDMPLVILRPLAVLLIGLVLALSSIRNFQSYRTVLLLLAAFAATMAVQLIPLPPALWRSLPFRDVYGAIVSDAGLGGLWRPISLIPDLTVNSLLALLVPFAALLGTATLDESGQRRLLACLLVAMAFSALLGLAQFVGGDASPLYLWARRSEAVADGVFANRNHQAVFLDCGLALIGAWITTPPAAAGRLAALGPRLGIGLVAALVLLVGVIATGSRTGTVLAIAAAAYSYWAVIRSAPLKSPRTHLTRIARLATRWAWIALPLLLVAMLIAGRASSFQRLMEIDASEDQRLRSFSTVIEMAKAVFPWGSGFGTFDPFFRTWEPDSLLHFKTFNHAHDDFLELLIVGGLPAVLVAAAAAVWWARSTGRAFLIAQTHHVGERGRAAGVAILLVALGSTVDYPARTPLVGCLLAILAIWLTDAGRGSTPLPDQAMIGPDAPAIRKP